MLQEIRIADEATYSAEGSSLQDLKEINFIFGTNGAGKTTISRVIANPATYPTCSLNWRLGQPIECLVYNRDFIEEPSGVNTTYVSHDLDLLSVKPVVDWTVLQFGGQLIGVGKINFIERRLFR